MSSLHSWRRLPPDVKAGLIAIGIGLTGFGACLVAILVAASRGQL